LRKKAPEWVAIAAAAWSSVVMASFACALELGLSGTIPFALVIPAMIKVHAVIGLAEGLITVVLVDFFRGLLKDGQE
jgi:cobalt/nickel transport system permease protein